MVVRKSQRENMMSKCDKKVTAMMRTEILCVTFMMILVTNKIKCVLSQQMCTVN